MAEDDRKPLTTHIENGRAPLVEVPDMSPCDEKTRLTTEYQAATETFKVRQ
jgi:hypothetical protein